MKSLFFDVETTGLDPRRCAIIQFAGIIDIDGAVVSEKEIKIRPFASARIDEDALKLRGIEPPIFETQEYVDERDAFHALQVWFGGTVDKFDKTDKFIPVAYNGNFDMDFLSELWNRHNDPYLGSYIDRARLVDPLRVIAWGLYAGVDVIRTLSLPNLKLATACAAFGIEQSPTHDALDDVRALRALTLKLKEC